MKYSHLFFMSIIFNLTGCGNEVKKLEELIKYPPLILPGKRQTSISYLQIAFTMEIQRMMSILIEQNPLLSSVDLKEGI